MGKRPCNVVICTNDVETLVHKEGLSDETYLKLRKSSPKIMAICFHINVWSNKYGAFNGISNVISKMSAMHIEPLKNVKYVDIIYSGNKNIYAQLPSGSGNQDTALDLFTDSIVSSISAKHFDFDYGIMHCRQYDINRN